MVALDIKMPTRCMNCDLLDKEIIRCSVRPRKDLPFYKIITEKPEWCPIKYEISEEEKE